MKKSVFGRHLKICLLSVPLMALAQPVVAQPVLQKLECLTHGPQLGNVSPTSIRVWARTREPATFRVVYSTAPDLSNALRSAPITTSWEHDATGWAQLSGLRPGTKYYYALELDGKLADTRVGGKINSFLTLPAAESYVDPQVNPKGVFNFAFEIGTGNNQGNQPLPPTYTRMLAELKDKIFFQIQNGDWLYEKGREQTEAQWASANGVAKLPRVAELAKGIAGVWNNYKLYLDGSPALADFYREVPLFVSLDDHEILNDVTGSGQTGFRIDARGKPWQTDLNRDDLQNDIERAVFRDPAVAAWRDYVGWSNPDIGNQQPSFFGKGEIQAGKTILTDPQADFTKLDLGKASNLHVLWGFGNTGVYKIARVIDRHRIEVEPGFTVSEEVRYSIGSNLWSKFRVSNADFFLLDTRSNRTLHNKDNLADPRTSMLGAKQKQWLLDELRKSDADFVFIVSSVNLAVPHDNGAWYGHGSGGAAKDDGWTAQLAERAELLKVAESLGKPVFFLTGDLHKSFVARVAPGVYDIASGPHTSSNHRIGDAGGSPPSGWYQSGDRLVNILWASNQYRNDTGGASGQARGKGWPIYTTIRVNNAFNIPDASGKDRWEAYPEPQVIFEFRDGYSGDLVFAHSVSTSEAKSQPTPVPAVVVKALGGIKE
ncbi:MAG: alkaline phosphatase D family protein [Sphingomonas sp.]|nr:alkaline phosphatase D family protein [Sphingomonas sp.]